jgi:hypothetical protein
MTEEPLGEQHSAGLPPPAAPEQPNAEERCDGSSPPPNVREVPTRKSSLAVTRLIQALWLGSGAFLILTASAAFSAASNTTDAANVVGAVLTRWHYIALLAPLLLLFLEWRRSRPVMLVILFIAIVLASFQSLLDTRIRIMRGDSIIPISSLPHDDPVRQRFGMLHGMSTLFLIGQVIVAGAAVATRE